LTDNIAKIPGETVLLIERLKAMSVGADYIAHWTASVPVLQKVLRRVQHCWGIKCPYKSLEPHYVKGDKLSTYNGLILQRKRVVIPERGQQQLLKGNAHPGKVAIQKVWRVATYGSQGGMMTLKLRSSCDNCPCKPECFRLAPLHPWQWQPTNIT